MAPQLIALIIVTPFILIFIYAGYHEYRRYKIEGRATYGLMFDEETGTSHVTGIADHEDAYDPDDFDPSAYNDPDVRNSEDDETDAAPERS